jgi:hypothetical protein
MSLIKIPLEVTLMIFSLLNRKEKYRFGRTCDRYYQIYLEKYVRLNPANYIFYRQYANRVIKKFEFKRIDFKGKYRFVVFETKGKEFRRRLNQTKEGMCCNSPTGSGIVYPVRRDRICDIFKSTCVKCEFLMNTEVCSVLNGNCGISTCQRNIVTSMSIYNVSSFNHVHHHRLCRECFDGISKTRSFMFNINNEYPETSREFNIQ